MALSMQAAVQAFFTALGCPVNANMSLQDLYNAAGAPAIAPSALGLSADGVPAIPFQIAQTFADGVSSDVVITAPAGFKFLVTDFNYHSHGANGSNANTVQLCAAAAGASPISDALSANGVADKGVVRAASIDYTAGIIAAGANLYLHRIKAGGVFAGVCHIFGVLTA